MGTTALGYHQGELWRLKRRRVPEAPRALKSRPLWPIEEHATETKDAFGVATDNPRGDGPQETWSQGASRQKGARGGRANKRVKKSDYKLDKIQKHRKFYTDVIIPSIPKLPKDHPLRKAYDKGGMAAFLNAFADGKGDTRSTTRSSFPRDNPFLKWPSSFSGNR